MLDADGLEIAFNGLNAARIAVDANSHVGIQELVRDVIGWVRYRITFHKPIGERELVEARLGRMLALMSACRALRKYCSAVLQQDFRGEAECVVAKTFGSDAAWEVVSDQYWKTIGGRVLLHGNPGGDKIHDIGAERTYEGENSMLLMKLFSTLVKVVGKKYLQPMINGVTEAGIKLPKIRGPLDGLLFGLKHPLTAFQLTMLAGPFALFLLRRTLWFKTKALLGHRDVEAALPKNMPAELRAHAKWAIVELQRMSIELSVAMLVTYRETLQDRQNRIVDLATKAQRLFVMVVTATQNAREDDKQLQMAAALMCRDLKRLVLSPSRSDAYYRAATKLGRALYTDGCPSVEHIHEHGVLAAYNDANELDMETVKPPTY
jgi:hypothetical protein